MLRFNKDVKSADAIRFADSALSHASKKSGTNTEMFTKERNVQLEQQMTVLNHLSYALKNREIFHESTAESRFANR